MTHWSPMNVTIIDDNNNSIDNNNYIIDGDDNDIITMPNCLNKWLEKTGIS